MSVLEEFELFDCWIFSRFYRFIKFVIEEMEKYCFNFFIRELIIFVWYEVVDDYIEMIKYRFYGDDEESKLKVKVVFYELFYNVMFLLVLFVLYIMEEFY